MSVPKSIIEVANNGIALVDVPSVTQHVVVGCASAGPMLTPRLVSYSSLLSTFQAGPAVKAAAYTQAQTDSNVIFVRVPSSPLAVTVSVDETAVQGTTSISTTGTPDDSYDIVFTVIDPGTIGTAGITYTLSLDGGATTGVETALGTNTSIVVGNITILFAAGTLLAADVVRIFTYPASETVYAIKFSGTAAVDITGTPIDSYRIRLEIITGGTFGVDGIRYRYSLDDGLSFREETRLGTADSIALEDYEGVSSGLTVQFTAGDTCFSGEVLTAATRGPSPQASDVVEAITEVEAGIYAADYACIHVVGDSSASLVGTVASKLAALYADQTFTFGLFGTRQKGTSEDPDEFAARLSAEFASTGDVRIAVSAGHARCLDPVSGYSWFRPASWLAMPRIIARPIGEDQGRKLTGSLPSDTSIWDIDNVRVEYDARVDSILHDNRFLTLRTYKGETGVYITQGRMMNPNGTDFRLIAYRRVMDVASAIFQKIGESQLNNNIRLDATTGKITEKDARKFDRDLQAALENVLLTTGQVSAIQVRLSRTDNLLVPNPVLNCDVRIVPLGYVGDFRGNIAFIAKLPTL